jgi:hypothetical protein
VVVRSARHALAPRAPLGDPRWLGTPPTVFDAKFLIQNKSSGVSPGQGIAQSRVVVVGHLHRPSRAPPSRSLAKLGAGLARRCFVDKVPFLVRGQPSPAHPSRSIPYCSGFCRVIFWLCVQSVNRSGRNSFPSISSSRSTTRSKTPYHTFSSLFVISVAPPSPVRGAHGFFP